MKLNISILSLAILLLVKGASATSPALPSLDKNFKFSCMIDLGVENENEKGQQEGYKTVRGNLEIFLKDESLQTSELAKKIKWTKWDREQQKGVPAEISELPGKPILVNASFFPVGGVDGHLGSYKISLEVEFIAQDGKSKIAVQAENSASTEKIGSFGSQTKTQASQKFVHNTIKYSLEMSCGAQN